MREWIMVLLSFTGFAAAGDVAIPLTLDRAASQLTTTLCIQTVCSSDTHPLDGEVLLALNCGDPPTKAALRDLRLAATTNHQANIDLGFGGKVRATLRDLVVRHAAPSSRPASEPLNGGQVVFRGISNVLSGTLSYEAEGLACVVVQLSGLKCVDVLDLADRPTNVIDTLQAHIAIENGKVQMTGTFQFREYIDPTQPEIGRVEGSVMFTAVGDLRPSLEIQLNNDRHEVRWCQGFSSYHLEQAGTLGGSWETVDATPEASSDEWSVTLPNPVSPTFYRLRAP